MVLRLQCDCGQLSSKHAKYALGILRHIERLEGLLALSRFLCDLYPQHLVHTVVLDHICIGVVGDEVIVLVIPGECPGADLVPCAVASKLYRLIHIPLAVLEANLNACVNRFVQLIDVVID